MTQYGFMFDMNRCYACQACSIACKDWNDIEPGAEKWMTVYEWEKGTFPNIRLNALAFPCAHCEDPSCMKVCPNGAIYKEDEFGAVLVDQDKCEGCRKCYEACPYGSPKFASDEQGAKMSKCTMCVDRLAEGMQPACTASCPLRAFDFGPLDELIEKYGDVRSVRACPLRTRPNPLSSSGTHARRRRSSPMTWMRPSGSISSVATWGRCSRARRTSRPSMRERFAVTSLS